MAAFAFYTSDLVGGEVRPILQFPKQEEIEQSSARHSSPIRNEPSRLETFLLAPSGLRGTLIAFRWYFRIARSELWSWQNTKRSGGAIMARQKTVINNLL